MKGKASIITGGGGGLGEAIGSLFCEEGGRVLLVDRKQAALEMVAARIATRVASAEVATIVGDVTRQDDALAAVEFANERFGGLDVLVNNAAIRDIASIETADIGKWNEILSVNLLGAVNFCKSALPALRQSGRASVINLSSVYGLKGRANWSAYDATKAGLLALTRSLACEEAVNGIRANAVCASATLTTFTVGRRKRSGKTEEEMRKEGRDDNLFRRWAEPREVAYPVLWLASDEASFVTGATLIVDGGKTIL
jgi:meso-butanediol dehydrogenase/(S,S)-butanediol dehydrogenase/diacetyl reductase